MTTRLEKIERELASKRFAWAGFGYVMQTVIAVGIRELEHEALLRAQGFTKADADEAGSWGALLDSMTPSYDEEYDEDGYFAGDPNADAWREYNNDIARQLMDVGYREAPDGSLYLPDADDEVPY